jgi:hypothetical protein
LQCYSQFQLVFIVLLLFKVSSFQSCYSLSGIRRAAFPFFVGTAKVEIFFNLSSFLFFYFSRI